MDVAITTITANRSHVEALNGFVSMRTSIVVRHRNVDGVHRIALGVSVSGCPVRAEERAQGYTPMPMKPLSPCRSPRCPNRGPRYSPASQGLVANRLLGPIHGRGVWLFGKWRDVVDQVRAFSAHGPDVPALGTAVVVSARQFARERQKPARRTVTRWTVRDRGHGWGTIHYPSEMAVRAIRESSYRNQSLCSQRSETPPLLSEGSGPDDPGGHHCAGRQ